MDLAALFTEIGQITAWGILGIVLLAIGYGVVDLLTPGKLGRLIYAEHNVNASIVLASGLLAIGAVVTTSIVASAEGFVVGLVTACSYGVLGIALLALSFLVVDRLSPGELGAIVTDSAPTPAAWIVAANHLVLGAILSAAIA